MRTVDHAALPASLPRVRLAAERIRWRSRFSVPASLDVAPLRWAVQNGGIPGRFAPTGASSTDLHHISPVPCISPSADSLVPQSRPADRYRQRAVGSRNTAWESPARWFPGCAESIRYCRRYAGRRNPPVAAVRATRQARSCKATSGRPHGPRGRSRPPADSPREAQRRLHTTQPAEGIVAGDACVTTPVRSRAVRFTPLHDTPESVGVHASACCARPSACRALSSPPQGRAFFPTPGLLYPISCAHQGLTPSARQRKPAREHCCLRAGSHWESSVTYNGSITVPCSAP